MIILSALSSNSGKSALFGEDDGVGDGDGDATNAITMLGSSLQEAPYTQFRRDAIE